MKILTGELKGRMLPLVQREGLRPTSDKVRKAVVDIFQGYFNQKRCLDLYCGTGAMGLEALSNGASSALFVEKDKSSASALRRAVQKWHLNGRAEIWNLDVQRAIDRLQFRGESFDWVSLDPPYEQGTGAVTLQSIAETDIVNPGGFVVLECQIREDLPERIGELQKIKESRYSHTKLIIFQNKKPGDQLA